MTVKPLPTIAVLSCNGGVITVADAAATRLLVATTHGVKVFERNDEDSVWRLTTSALETLHISAILYEPRSGLVFAGAHWGGGLYVSNDGGLTFAPSMDGIARKHIYTLVVQHRGEQTVLLAGTEPSAVYRSDDLGKSWHDLPGIWAVPDTDQWAFPPPPHVAHVKNIAWHDSDPQKLFVCIEQGALLISEDDGRTWVENRAYAKPGEDMFRHDNHRVLFQKDPRRYFMCGGEGIHFTTDDGATWEHLQTRDDRIGYPDAMFIDPRDENTVYVAGPKAPPRIWPEWGTAKATFMASLDGGHTWQERRTGIPADLVGNIEATGMHWHGDRITITAGTSTGEIFITEDEGAHWNLLASGLPPIAKNGHSRWFLPPEERAAAEAMMRQAGAEYV